MPPTTSSNTAYLDWQRQTERHEGLKRGADTAAYWAHNGALHHALNTKRTEAAASVTREGAIQATPLSLYMEQVDDG